ncbi:SDR family NAD(P)-dependent oxidoreductase [Streptomyces sp. NPDC101112]|uniref:SDR family NAD(P)-dependent oxidoreductase n=1 Tax=Streptomyces sp. NPDC101112 TaxID=3366105 RepID=UPI00382871EF
MERSNEGVNGGASAETLLDVLLGAAREVPERTVVHVRADGAEHTVTFAGLRDEALRVAGGLIEAGVTAGTPLPLVADRGEDFQPMFWGALAAGAVPVPLAPEPRRVGPVWELLGRPPVVVDASTAPLLGELDAAVAALPLDALREGRPLRRPHRPAPDDVAFLQFSSGSTGSPKGVELTHAGVLANLRQIRTAMAITGDDVIATWMPYFHDMGLIGTHLVPMAARVRQIRVEPLSFAKRPALWLEAAARHRATLLSAANFALDLAVRRIPAATLAGLDLSPVRLLLVGAEPIAPRVWRAFQAHTAPAGLDPCASLPVYGLAEATLAVTVPPLGERAEPVVLDRAALSRGRAVETAPGPDAVELMDLGLPVEGCEVRITGPAGDGEGDGGAGNPAGARAARGVLGEARVGHVEVRGPQVGRGYHRAPGASAEAFGDDGWLRTGDLGFLRAGRLVVTGRHKDVVFVNGRTFHASDLEETVAATPGLPSGTTAAVVGSTDPDGGGERVVAFVRWARPPATTAAPVLRAAAGRLREVLGHDDVRVLPLPPAAFPRTTSGKLRRGALRERFEAGGFATVEERWGDTATGRAGAVGEHCGGGETRRGADSVAGAPRSVRDVREAVRRVWAGVLERPEAEIGLHDRFFDLGGSSLKAMAVLAELEDTFAVTVEPKALRDHDTVAGLAGYLVEAAAERGPVAAGPLTEAGPADVAAASAAAVPRGRRDRSRSGVVSSGAVAVLSVACRFPGVGSPEEFWELLAAGGDTVGAIPEDRWGNGPLPSTRFGSFLPEPAAFDADFFGMDDAEARATDPQARIFLELAHEALERAGYAGPRRAGRRVGVFAATGDSGYREVLAEAADGDLARHPAALTGNLPNLIAARVSQVLDLTGPALAVDTACSSALVALHLARRSLAAGECDLAVVGGVNLGLTGTGHRLLEATGALSPTGRCRAFDADADGFVPGEGGAVLVLARLDEARAADDPVLALVRGTAVNNDGRSLGLLAPTPRGQREVIARAYEECGVDPAAVSYVEAHGTGTPIGDPVEARSLGRAFPPRPDGLPRRLGSVKANLGHLLNAAGMPALVKVVLALTHRQLPPVPHAARPAPFLADTTPGFRLVTEPEPWTTPDGSPLTAGVNAFGFGGTNAHAILEEAPDATGRPDRGEAGRPGRARSVGAAVDASEPSLLTLSARTPGALRAAVAELAAHLRARPDLAEADVCAAVGTARDEAPYRLAVAADGDLLARLEAATHAGDAEPTRARPRTVFVLPGQGAQRPAVARALYRSAPAFRDTLGEASALVGPVLGRSLTAWCLDEDVAPEALARTEVAQPLLVAFGAALSAQLGAWGVRPDAVIGHSVGEITAAHVAGALSLPDALAFAAERGRLIGELAAPGAMAAVQGDEDTVAPVTAASDGALCVAAVNSPTQLVIAGASDAVDRAIAALTARGVAARRLRVSHAFHSPLLEPVLDPLGNAAKALAVRPAAVPMLSTVSGQWGPDLNPEYWREHAARPVRFGAAVARLLDEGYDTFVELGPGDTLSGPVRTIAAAPAGEGAEFPSSSSGVAYLPALSPAPGVAPDGGTAGSSGAHSLLETVGRLWTRGAPLSPTAPARVRAGHRRVPVPTYPFQRRRYWPERLDAPPAPHGTPPALDLDGGPVPRPLLWRDAPLLAAPGPRVVRLAGADTALARALADRLTEHGVTVLGPDDSSPSGPNAPETLVWFAEDTTESTTGTTTTTNADAIASLRGVLALFGTAPARLLLVTEDAYTTGSGDAPERARGAGALLHGFALALPDEHPALSSRGVDLSSGDPLATRLQSLERELYAADAPDGTPGGLPGDTPGSAVGALGTVAWRASRRLARTPVASPGTTRTTADVLPPNGTYLITGGAGGLGSALARDLAERGAPDLVLTGRTPTPPRALLAELRALGARARYQAADVSDAGAIDDLVAGLPPLHGVFHAAGTARPGSLRGKSDGEIEETLAAKVHGTVLLAEALRRYGHDTAVRVAFSSVSSVLPGLSGALGDYAAANAFLDAFTTAEHAAGRPWRTIALGPVSDTGLASGPRAEDRLRARGLAPMPVRAALTALRTALTLDAPHVLVTGTTKPTPTPTPRPAQSPAPAPTALAPASAPTPTPTSSATSASGTAPEITALLRRLLAEALHRSPEDIAEDAPFLGLGLDSLSAVDLARRLERELGRPLPATLLFEYRTIGELAAHLATGTPTAAPPALPAAPPTTEADRRDDGLLPLTPLQLAFHTSASLHEGVTAYGYVRQTVSGPLDPALLGRAFAHLALRQPLLRMRLTRDGGVRPRQYTAPAEVPTAHGSGPAWYEIRQVPAGPRALADLEQALCNRPFDLTTEDPVRALLVPDQEDAHLTHLLLVVHHAAADGYSLKVLSEDLWSLYTALARGEGVAHELPLVSGEFGDYVAALTAERHSPAFERDQRYWRDRLTTHLSAHSTASATPAPALPYDGDPEAPPVPPLVHHRTEVDEELTSALREVAALHEVSLFHLLLAAYGRCLARWSGRPEVAVNVARARREAAIAGVDRLVGPLADTLPVFMTVGPDEPVTALADRVREIWREAEAHATLGSADLARLLGEVRPATGPAPRTVAEAGFSFARFPVVHGPDWPVTVTPTAAATATAATRLGLLCWEADASLRLSWNHPARLFRPETVRGLADAYVSELRAVAAGLTGPAVALAPHRQQPARPAAGLAAQPAAGRGQPGIVDRLCARFRGTPEAVAVHTGDSTLTYAALDTASTALAARLRAHGVRPGDLVGLLTEPGGTATVTGVVGILRAGAGWVPLDATHPAARHQDQLARTGVRVLVCDPANHEAAARLEGVVPVATTDAPSPLPDGSAADLVDAAPYDPEAVAYVIFTSGSTGRPKAVPVTHRSMANYLDWALATFGYGPGDRLAQTASVCFDASVRQLLAPLLVGASVHTVSRDLLRDPEALLDRVVADRITVWSSVPTLWERLLTAAEERVRRDGAAPPDLSALRWVHVGGEALPAAHVRRWFDLLDATATPIPYPGTPGAPSAPDARRVRHRVANLYGPTEATINATCHIIDTRPADDVRHLPIGRPIAGTELTVVDADGRACAPGEAGELLIAGTGLTPGYLGDPHLTAAAFTERDGRRWYRSGDRVRRTADGVLEFLGRLDDQVKVRGHRVELGEVEAALLAHPGLARAAVLLREGRLVAYVEPRAGAPEPDAREVRSFLSRTLPPYMLPARIHALAALPLTGTGKIDRNRLAVPEVPGAATGRTAPRTLPATPTERLLARAWSLLLDVPEVFREDDFFVLGGDSLTVLELFSRLRDDHRVLPRPTAVYTHRTLSALAAAIDTANDTAAADALPVAEPAPAAPASPTTPVTPYPLTPSQRGFLLADALASGDSAWLARFRIRGPLRPELFQRAVDVLVARHPMLRTVFPAGARPPVQQELPDTLRLPVETETLSEPGLLERRIAEEARRRFEPWAWPLLRLRLFTVTDQHVLVVHAHHLIGDGYSAALLTRELLTVHDRLAAGRSHGLEPLRSTFRDHVELRATRRRAPSPTPGTATANHLARHHAPYTPPVLHASRPPADGTGAPTDPRTPGFHTAGFTLDADRAGALRRLARTAGTTPYAPFLTAYHRALVGLTGHRDLVLGLAVTGRDDSVPDAHRVFGPFAEAVAVRPPVHGEGPGTFVEDLRRVAAEAVAARTAGPLDLRTDDGLPRTAQFFFTFLDFGSLGTPGGTALTVLPDDTDTALAPPPVGTDVFLAVRPSGDGVRVTVRASASALTDEELAAFADGLRRELEDSAPLDAALIGYLPAPRDLAAYAGLPPHAVPGREQLRALLFPDGHPRLLETTTTPLGASGFLALPVFADELTALATPDDRSSLAARTARAVEHALALGARSVSLAGVIPALTGYGYDVLREAEPNAPSTSVSAATSAAAPLPGALTTGHATTTVAVVKTVHAALAATGRDLAGLTLAVVGCGSIGTSSLRLLLARSPRPPARLILCDLPGSAPRLRRLAAELSTDHPGTAVRVMESTGTPTGLPAELYEDADVVVTAVSGPTALLDVDRLRPGTIVVDDSFPHCFDTARALDRMRRERDVLLVGGGLLALGTTETRLSTDLPSLVRTGPTRGTQFQPHLPGTLASCRLESLLHAHHDGTELPPIHGLVDLPHALAHWDAAEAAGVTAAPLHLLDHVIPETTLKALPRPRTLRP